jgi:hypothetical protein
MRVATRGRVEDCSRDLRGCEGRGGQGNLEAKPTWIVVPHVYSVVNNLGFRPRGRHSKRSLSIIFKRGRLLHGEEKLLMSGVGREGSARWRSESGNGALFKVRWEESRWEQKPDRGSAYKSAA